MGRGGIILQDGRGRGDAAVTDSQHYSTAWVELRQLARWNGLELSEEDARDLLPYHDQQRRWLQTLRRVLDEEEEPATEFSAANSRNVSE
jgi:hypothetical protein